MQEKVQVEVVGAGDRDRTGDVQLGKPATPLSQHLPIDVVIHIREENDLDSQPPFVYTPLT